MFAVNSLCAVPSYLQPGRISDLLSKMANNKLALHGYEQLQDAFVFGAVAWRQFMQYLPANIQQDGRFMAADGGVCFTPVTNTCCLTNYRGHRFFIRRARGSYSKCGSSSR